ncbi:MAG: prepilin-type N-terminal cleavage/methylation domain-containing protein [Proteobacteria bacterium]|nr:prepilin-type N-terminal cleavage/methylation domain-containing protein [Pseudomonadota bacterium]
MKPKFQIRRGRIGNAGRIGQSSAFSQIPNPVPRRRPPAQAGGFTLIELVAAFVIFALGFGVLLQILSTCLHTTAQAADYTRAALWAQSLLDVQGVGEPLKDGDYSGAFDDQYRWRLQVAQIPSQDIAPIASAVPTAGNAGAAPVQAVPVAPSVDLYRLQLDVTWGSVYLQHDARFVTLRAQNADIANAVQQPALPPRGRGRP